MYLSRFFSSLLELFFFVVGLVKAQSHISDDFTFSLDICAHKSFFHTKMCTLIQTENENSA